MVECHTLGPLQVRIDGRRPPPDLVWRKNIGLLIYLARSPHRSLTRDHLVATFWGGKPLGRARHSLREALRVVRRHLGDRVHADAHQVRLADAALVLDLTPFEQYIRAKQWHRAWQLIRGDFLEGFHVPDARAFTSWLDGERRKWRARMLEAVNHLATPFLEAGRTDDAAPMVAKALRIAPCAADALNLFVRFGTVLAARDGITRTRLAFDSYLEQCGINPCDLPIDLYDRLRRDGLGPP